MERIENLAARRRRLEKADQVCSLAEVFVRRARKRKDPALARKAMTLYSEALSLDEHSLKAYLGLALLSYTYGSSESALRLINQAARISPTDPHVQRLQGLLRGELDRQGKERHLSRRASQALGDEPKEGLGSKLMKRLTGNLPPLPEAPPPAPVAALPQVPTTTPRATPATPAPVAAPPVAAAAPLRQLTQDLGPPKYSELVSQGPEVGWLQSALKSLAYPVEVTDFYDKETYVAVRNYQLSARLPITGIVDKKTRQALNKVLASPPKQVAPAAPQRGTRELHLSLVQTPEEIREVQMALQGLHIPVPLSGVLDRELENAVRVFQTRQRLPVTGVVDARTRDKLRPFIRLTQVRSRIEKEVSELVSIFRQERGLGWDKWRLAHLRCTLEQLAEGWLNPDRISDLDPEAPVPEPRKPDTASRDFLQHDLGSQGLPGVVFRGLEVQRLQEVLQEAGLEVNITGQYDLQTFSAVKVYQQQQHLPPTGLVDAATREPVNAALVLRYEAEFARETLEAEIRVLETVLKAPEDPEQLGRLHQAIEDLLFGQQVALTQALAPPGRGKLSDGPEVALLQELLEVPVTGQFDGPTAQALMRFQRQQRLPQSGWVDDPTREALNTLLNTCLEAP